MKYIELFIDELGNYNPIDKKSQVYILSGCAVDLETRKCLKIRADQIKFKYWGHTKVIFHSREIGRKKRDFSIFKRKPKFFKSFLEDLFSMLKDVNLTVFSVVCNKEISKKNGWNSTKIIKTTSRSLIRSYVIWLLGLGSVNGKITIESATAEKDKYYLEEFSYFLSPGCKELLGVEYKKIKSILTSISFVTKLNQDIEEQVADLFAYAIKCKYFKTKKLEEYKKDSYEDRIIKILNTKMFKLPSNAKEKKLKYYRNVDSFVVVPRK